MDEFISSSGPIGEQRAQLGIMGSGLDRVLNNVGLKVSSAEKQTSKQTTLSRKQISKQTKTKTATTTTTKTPKLCHSFLRSFIPDFSRGQLAIKVLGVCQKRGMTHQALSLLSFLYTMGKVVGRVYVILHNKLD